MSGCRPLNTGFTYVSNHNAFTLIGLNLRSEVITGDDGHFYLVAHRKGFPVAESYGQVFVPPTLGLIWDAWRTLRYLVVHRGHWIIEVTRVNPQTANKEIVKTIEVASRGEAIRRFDSEVASLRALEADQ